VVRPVQTRTGFSGRDDCVPRRRRGVERSWPNSHYLAARPTSDRFARSAGATSIKAMIDAHGVHQTTGFCEFLRRWPGIDVLLGLGGDSQMAEDQCRRPLRLDHSKIVRPLFHDGEGGGGERLYRGADSLNRGPLVLTAMNEKPWPVPTSPQRLVQPVLHHAFEQT
jgi:hypothetical protein